MRGRARRELHPTAPALAPALPHPTERHAAAGPRSVPRELGAVLSLPSLLGSKRLRERAVPGARVWSKSLPGGRERAITRAEGASCRRERGVTRGPEKHKEEQGQKDRYQKQRKTNKTNSARNPPTAPGPSQNGKQTAQPDHRGQPRSRQGLEGGREPALEEPSPPQGGRAVSEPGLAWEHTARVEDADFRAGVW